MMVISVNGVLNMEKLILFPKQEVLLFNQAIACYNKKAYQKAVSLFENLKNFNYYQSKCIKYLIECHIELCNYEKVYQIIEDEFVEQNLDEEYLLKRYLYTMVLDHHYFESEEIINIYLKCPHISKSLRKYLLDLKIIMKERLNSKEQIEQFEMKKHLESDKFEDHIQIILNLDSLKTVPNLDDLLKFLSREEVDSFVKYNLLKYLFEQNLISEVPYVNYFNQLCLVKKEEFVDVFNDERYLKPIELVKHRLAKKGITTDYVSNVWLDYCLKCYPKLIDDNRVGACLLHAMILKSMLVDFNLDSLCFLYNLKQNDLFSHFNQ
jgi:tetratricopeptide (TPR) repeat protein